MQLLALVIDLILVAAAGLLLVPALTLAAQVVASLLPGRRAETGRGPRGGAVILIPAHDEAAAIEGAVRSVSAQMSPADRLIVVADNCVDETAALARAAGAEVVERHDTTRIGKGYALDAGLRFASESGPRDTIVFVDADNRQVDLGDDPAYVPDDVTDLLSPRAVR